MPGTFLRRIAKICAAIAIVAGLGAAFLGTLAGNMMGGSVLSGDPHQNFLTLSFVTLPFVATGLFILAVVREGHRPTASTLIYTGIIAIIAIQLVIPALP